MQKQERQKLRHIAFTYGVTSETTANRLKYNNWAPTIIFVRIVSQDAARDPSRAYNHPGTVGEATIYLYDLQQMCDCGRDVWDELDCYSGATSRLGDLICKDDQPVTRKFCAQLSKAFHTTVRQDEIQRIAYVERRTTKARYRGNDITSLFYEDIFRMFNPDVILTYPFPLQYEGTRELNPHKNDEFRLTFQQAMAKLKGVYRRAGMRNVGPLWMASLNPRLIR